MARRRDYAAEYARRQAKARREGFAGYYQRRTAERATRPLSELRGHAGPADLRRLLRSGRVDILTQEPGARNRRGQIQSVRITAQLTDGSQRSFTIRGKAISDPARLRPLRRAIRDGGADVYVTPSPDVLRLRDVEDDLEIVVEAA